MPLQTSGVPARRRYRFRRWGLAVFGAVAVVAMAITLAMASRLHEAWSVDPLARPVILVQFASTATAIAAGAWMIWRRPANRCGPIAVLLGVVFAFWWTLFFAFPRDAGWVFASSLLVASLRPLLFWLVLAFPIGRLDRVSRKAFAVIIIGPVLGTVVATLTKSTDDFWPDLFGIWKQSPFTLLASSIWWDVGALFAAAAVLVIVHRRALRFRGFGDQLGATAFWAAAIATGADFLLIGTGPIRDLQTDEHLTPFGMVVQLIDLGRWGAVVLLLAVAARRSWPPDALVGDAIDLDRAGLDDSLRAALARALGDPEADVAVRDARSGWLDLAGHGRVEPGTDRAATIVSHLGEPVAALEYDDALSAHPAVIDAAVAALALQLESARQLALARNRELEVRRLGVQVLEAEDDARRRLERDLHDGAQQALVGVTLQAALAARDGAAGSAAAVEHLADAIDEVAVMLHGMATGRPPALLIERGLDGALGALMVTAGLPVTVDVDRCDDLPDALQRAIWFTAAEAVTNALKHARAGHLQVTLRRASDGVQLVVADDGTGGVEQPPASLLRRVEGACGSLHIESTPAGTTVHARFPLEAVVAG